MHGNLIIISSPSGGGKGTLIGEVRRTMPEIRFSVSYTTRAIRSGEENGREYFFTDRSNFEKLIADGEFLEYAEVHGNLYGTSRKQVEAIMDTGQDVLLEIDVQGALILHRTMPDAVSIFILPPSFEVLRERLTRRATEGPDDLMVRLKNSFREVKAFDSFRYVVVNEDLERAANDLRTIIHAERLRMIRQIDEIRVILDGFEASMREFQTD